ncbi:uncharacterized protein [Apostichopus japonicus]|uniref:uncharacterized protein isoform X2 n=1 Tax=Stichopus japonicus TaxID=307972 RepID=UPI003AB80BBF
MQAMPYRNNRYFYSCTTQSHSSQICMLKMVHTRNSPGEPFRELDSNLSKKENISPVANGRRRVTVTPGKPFPFLPKSDKFLHKSQLVESDVSPVLQKLKQTPGRTYQTQQILMRKHQKAKSNAEKCVGGGISLWPGMDNMRLTPSDLWSLVANVVTLFVLTLGAFSFLHGAVLRDLNHFIRQIGSFSSQHPLITSDQTLFVESLLRWHGDYTQLLKQVTKSVEVSWESCPPSYPLAIFLYCSGMCILLYYVYENVFSKNRLTPQRIKQWVSLLVILMTWTVLMLYLLIQAQTMEHLIRRNIHILNNYLEELVYSELDLTKYESILQYWVTRCLPPRSQGVLSILGVVKVQDFTYYFIYYLVPVATALLTPIVKLIVSLYEVYKVQPHQEHVWSMGE